MLFFLSLGIQLRDQKNENREKKMSLFIYCLFVWKYRPKVLLICGIRVGNSCNYFREIHALHTNDSQKIYSCILRQFGRYNLIVHVYPKKVTFFWFQKKFSEFCEPHLLNMP